MRRGTASRRLLTGKDLIGSSSCLVGNRDRSGERAFSPGLRLTQVAAALVIPTEGDRRHWQEAASREIDGLSGADLGVGHLQVGGPGGARQCNHRQRHHNQDDLVKCPRRQAHLLVSSRRGPVPGPRMCWVEFHGAGSTLIPRRLTEKLASECVRWCSATQEQDVSSRSEQRRRRLSRLSNRSPPPSPAGPIASGSLC